MAYRQQQVVWTHPLRPSIYFHPDPTSWKYVFRMNRRVDAIHYHVTSQRRSKSTYWQPHQPYPLPTIRQELPVIGQHTTATNYRSQFVDEATVTNTILDNELAVSSF